MDEKAKLLEQLRIDRSADRTPPGGGGRQWLWMLVVALLASALTWYLTRSFGTPATAPAAADSTAQSASGNDTGANASAPSTGSATTPATGSSALDATGYVVARRIATVSATIPGRLVAVLIDEGSHVKAGQVLARLDDTDARLQVDRARAQLEQSRAQLGQAQVAAADAARNYQRASKLHDTGIVSQQDLDSRKAASEQQDAAVEASRRAVDAASAQVASAERYLRETVVRAPFDGVITVKQAQPGEIISPAAAGGGFTRTGIGTIVDMDSLEVEVDVSENFITRVSSGQAAEVRLNAYPDWAIPAEVIAIIPTADKAKATVKVRVGFKVRDARILPDMGARVSFRDTRSDARG